MPCNPLKGNYRYAFAMKRFEKIHSTKGGFPRPLCILGD